MKRPFSICMLSALLWSHTAAAQTAAPLPSVSVSATRDPVDKSYRRMVQGMQRFARDHALAPHAQLRFQLLPRRPGVSLDGVRLRIAGDAITLPVTLAPDHSFTLDYNEQALREDAAVLANRKTNSMTWRAQVRSPGVPPGMRRLGDLRLECRVGVEAGLISTDGGLLDWLSDKLSDVADICGTPNGNYLFFADRPLWGVTVRDGAREARLPFQMLYAGGTQTATERVHCDCQVLLEQTYFAPIWDASWSDETLLAFDDIDDAGAPPIPPAAAQGTVQGAAQ